MAHLLACSRMFQSCRIFRRYITCMVSFLFRHQASILGNEIFLLRNTFEILRNICVKYYSVLVHGSDGIQWF